MSTFHFQSLALKEVPKMLLLIFNNRMANLFIEKADVLKEAFFPALLAANLSDLKDYIYPSAKDS